MCRVSFPLASRRPPDSFGLGGLVLGLLAALTAVAAAAAVPDERPADLVLLGGKIVTMDDRRPCVEALAARDGRILAVGNNAQVRRCIGPNSQVIDLRGRLAVPGFIDSHGHFVELGRSKMMLDLTKARDFDDIVALVRQAAEKAPAGRWIEGRGWHQSKWKHKPRPSLDGNPTHAKLSRAAPANPVLLTHATGHSCLANALAMEFGGVNRNTPDPPGGEILRDADGNPGGVFREDAMELICRARAREQSERTPADRSEELDEAIRLASEECLSKGVTSFHDAGASFATVDRFRKLAMAGRLKVRLYVMLNGPNDVLDDRLPQYRMLGVGDHHLTVRAIKRLLDGALGTHGAWFFTHYEDLPGSSGLNTLPIASLRETARLAAKHGFQLCVHAIGDRANRETLDLYAEVFQKHPEETDVRWRIEHAQHLHADDVGRFARLGVIASMQGVHATSDAPFVVARLGRRRAEEGAYVWQKLLQSGAVIANGTDTPVEDVDPIACFYASVTRRLPDGSVFFSAQRMTRRQALQSYTQSAAYAAFEEDLKGSLVPGKLADVVVLSEDIMTLPEAEIPQAKVTMTIVGGKVLYRRGG